LTIGNLISGASSLEGFSKRNGLADSFLFVLYTSNLSPNPIDLALYAAQSEANYFQDVCTLILWNNELSFNDFSPTILKICLLSSEILLIVPENRQLLLGSEMIKVIQLDEEEFRIVGMIVTALQHQSTESLPPSLSNLVLFALLTACSTFALLITILFKRYNQPFMFQLTDKRIQDAPADMAERSQ
jgi:hypothetical protein